MPINIPEKMIRMIENLVIEQNRQLLKIIAYEEDMKYEELLTRYISNSPLVSPLLVPLPAPASASSSACIPSSVKSLNK